MRRSGRPIIAQGTVTRGMTTHMLRFEWKASSFCGRYSLSLQELLRGRCVCRGNVVTARSSGVRRPIAFQDGMDVPAWVDSAARLVDLRSKAASPE